MERDSDTMNSHGRDEHRREVPDPTTVAGVLLVLTALLPYIVMFSVPETVFVDAQLWNYSYGQLRLVSIDSFMTPLIFLSLRYVFAVQMMRYYRGSTSKRRVLATGLVAEVPLLLLSTEFLLTWLVSGQYLVVVIPVPIPLLVALLVVRRFPPHHSDDKWLEAK